MQQQPTQQQKGKFFFWGVFALLFLCGPCNTLTEWMTPKATPTAQEQVILTAPKTTVLHRVGSSEAEVLHDQTAEVHKGDRVTARSAGEGLLQFPDAVWVRIFQNTNLQYKTEIDPNAEPVRRLFLEKGAITGESLAEARASQRLVIETDWVVIRENGTRFWVYYDPVSGINWVVVLEGAVELTAINSGQRVTIPAGYQSWAIRGNAPAEPVPASRRELAQLGLTFPRMDELSLGAITEAEWLPQSIAPQIINTPTDTPALPAPPQPTDTPTETPIETPTETPTITPEAPVIADAEAPIIGELTHDPDLIVYSSCIADQPKVTFFVTVNDATGITSVEFQYRYWQSGQPVSSWASGSMAGQPPTFSIVLDFVAEANKLFQGSNGRLEYQIIATDSVPGKPNSSATGEGNFVEILNSPC